MGVINLDGSDRSIAALSVFPTVDRIELLSVRAVKQGEGKKEGRKESVRAKQRRGEGALFTTTVPITRTDGRDGRGRAYGGPAIIAGDASGKRG